MAASPFPTPTIPDVSPDWVIDADVTRMVDSASSEGVQQEALARLFSLYRERLLRMIEFRLHPQVRPRVDPWDVLQESYLDASQRIAHFRAFRGTFFKWLRLVVLQRIHWLHRHHLVVQMRDAHHDVSLDGAWSADDDGRLAAVLAGSLTSPSQAVQREELMQVVNQVLSGLKAIDREVLVLRHFEHLGNAEAAEVLDITPVAASIRYSRALARLTSAMSQIAPAER